MSLSINTYIILYSFLIIKSYDLGILTIKSIMNLFYGKFNSFL